MFAARCEEYSTQVNDDIEHEDDEDLKFLVFICFFIQKAPTCKHQTFESSVKLNWIFSTFFQQIGFLDLNCIILNAEYFQANNTEHMFSTVS